MTCWLILCALLGCMASDVEAASARIASYREPPYGACRFAQERFGFTPDKWQEQVLVAFVDPRPEYRRIAMSACAGPGKTAVEAVCGWHFLATQCLEPGEHPKGLVTSVTEDNLRDNLWAEFSKWQQRDPWLLSSFTWTATRIYCNDHPNTWFLGARTWPKTANLDTQGRTFSGIHSKSVAFFVDESGSIPPTILRAAEQALPGTRFGKILQGGNPISLEGMLHEAVVRLRGQWFVVRITGDPDDPDAWVNAPRIVHAVQPGDQSPAAWAREQIETYGRDNPWVLSYILGQFPPASINALLGIEDVEAAMRRHLTPDQYAWAQKRLGIDVARFGDDRTVIFPRQGLAAFRPVVMRHKRDSEVSVHIANRTMAAKLKWGSEREYFDATGGWAAGAVDIMRAAGYSPVNVQFASKQTIKPAYYNRRAECGWEAAQWILGGGALPPIGEFVGEATSITYTFKDGKILLNPKEIVKKLLGRSPDLWEGFTLTFGEPDMPAFVPGPAGRRQDVGHAKTDFDPDR